jgi:hypothetical protein
MPPMIVAANVLLLTAIERTHAGQHIKIGEAAQPLKAHCACGALVRSCRRPAYVVGTKVAGENSGNIAATRKFAWESKCATCSETLNA